MIVNASLWTFKMVSRDGRKQHQHENPASEPEAAWEARARCRSDTGVAWPWMAAKAFQVMCCLVLPY